MIYDPELDDFICKSCGIPPPLTYGKIKSAALKRGLVLKAYMLKQGVRYIIEQEDPKQFYKTKTAAYREGLIRDILNENNTDRRTGSEG
jgi:hypothetical protein